MDFPKVKASGKRHSGGDGNGLRWRLVLVAGTVVGVLPYALSVLLINIYATVNHLTNGNLDALYTTITGSSAAENLGTLLARSGTPVFYLVGAVLAAMYVGRRVGASAVLHGVGIGVVGLLVSSAITIPFFGWPEPYEWIVYPVVLLGGGFLGGIKGWEIRAGDFAMSEANRAVGAAGSAREIVAALGENLTGSTILEVGLWGMDDDRPLAFMAGWNAGDNRPLSPEMGFGTSRDIVRLSEATRLRQREIKAADRAVWTNRGVKSALLLPLFSHTGDARAVMLVASGKSRGFSGRDVRAYSTIAATAALALENLRLVEEAETSGKKAGTLEERQRLAHEIHDTLAQGFTSIVTNLEAADSMMDRRGAERAVWHLDQARKVARESLAEARRLVWALGPGTLEHDPLPDALVNLVEKWEASTGVTAGTTVVGDTSPLPAESESALLRAAQESLANVAKHAGASRVALTISYMPGSVTLDVRDDGVGFIVPEKDSRPAPDGSGFGLRAMRERVEKLGGRVSVESEVGEGTTVSVEVPAGAAKRRYGRLRERIEGGVR